MFASSIFSGTLVDVIGRRRMAVISDAASCLAVAMIPLLDLIGGLNLLTIVIAAMLGAAFDPAGSPPARRCSPPQRSAAGWTLDRANGVHEAVWGVAFLAGPGIGGVLIATIGAVDTMLVTAGGFAASVLLLATLRLPGAGRPAAHERPQSIWEGTREGLSFLWREPLLREMGS